MESLAIAEVLLAGRSDWLDEPGVSGLAEHPLESVETEYPHYVGAVGDPEGPEPPRERHPVFYGCFDWHSAVHSHWALVRQLRLFDDHPDADAITESIDRRLTDSNVRTEREYFEANPTFEKPYGWAWLLHLAAELDRWDDERADDWHSTLAPLESDVAELVRSEFPADDRPFGVGTHGNTAFSLHCVLDYARSVGDASLETAVVETATAFYGDDREYPLRYEPLGWDFLSPALTEADLVRRVHDRPAFASWLEAFLPEPAGPLPLDPIEVDDDAEEGIALHYVGLDLARAWSLAGIADALDGHDAAGTLERAAGRHAECGLRQAFTGEYAGAHWLSSFALCLVTRNEGGIAPA